MLKKLIARIEKRRAAVKARQEEAKTARMTKADKKARQEANDPSKMMERMREAQRRLSAQGWRPVKARRTDPTTPRAREIAEENARWNAGRPACQHRPVAVDKIRREIRRTIASARVAA
jgi:hypothetical protein